MAPTYQWLLTPKAAERIERWLEALDQGRERPGARLAGLFEHGLSGPATVEQAVGALLRTKQPQIFAESAVRGDGSDWTPTELSLLGDILCAMPVTVFDDGTHAGPKVHQPPFGGHLIFVPGALLRNGHGVRTADLLEVAPDGEIDAAAYDRLHERRLVPAFAWANEVAQMAGRPAVVTVPGLGCGQFAGRWRGQMGARLARALRCVLERHGAQWPALRLVHYDPYNECDNAAVRITRDLTFRIRPLTLGRGHPQLSRPAVFDEGDDGLQDALLFSLVAWDHVSWPGNDFWGGARATDDGVKAAATDCMYRITGVEGHYDPDRNCYRPPPGGGTWEALVKQRGIRLDTMGQLHFY